MRIITTSRDATIRCWKAADDTTSSQQPNSEFISILHPVSLPLQSSSSSAAASAASSAAALSSVSPTSGGVVAPASSSSGASPYRCYEGHSEWITSGVLLSDARTLVTGSIDTTVKLWNIRSDQPNDCIATLSHHTDYVQSLSYCPWNQMLITAGLNFELYSWRVDAPGAPKLVSDLSGGGNDSSANAPSPTHAELGMHEFDCLRGSFYATALSENGNTLLTGSSDEIVRLYDTRCLAGTGAALNPSNNCWLKLLGHQDNIRSVALNERVGTGQSMAYTSSCDASIRVWDLRMQRCLKCIFPASTADRATSKPIPRDRLTDLREQLRCQNARAAAQQYGRTVRNLSRTATSVGFGLASSTSSPSPMPMPPSASPPPQSNAIWCMALDATCTKAFTAGAGSTIWLTDLTSGVSQPVVRFLSNPSSPIASSTVSLTLDQARGTLWVGAWDGTLSGWDVSACLNGAIKTVDATSHSGRARHSTCSPAPGPLSARTATAGSASARPRAKGNLPQTHSAPSSSDEEEEEAAGIFPFLLSAPSYMLPVAPLPPVEAFCLLHDRVHALVKHFNNSAAFDLATPPTASGGGIASSAPANVASSPSTIGAGGGAFPQIVSTWNILEGVCIDVARLPAQQPQQPNSLDHLATILNAEFAKRAVPLAGPAALAKDGAPLPSHKLLPSWCTLSASLGCLSIGIDRKTVFAADVSAWFEAAIGRLQAVQATVVKESKEAIASHALAPADAALVGTSLHPHPSPSSARLNLGEILLYNLTTEWQSIEGHLVKSAGVVGGDPDARLLRPVPPSSRWLANVLFPGAITHGLAGSLPMVRAWAAAQDGHANPSSSPLLGASHAATHARASSAIHLRSHYSAAEAHSRESSGSGGGGGARSIVGAPPPSGVGTAISLIILPHKSTVYLPLACSLPMSATGAAPSSSRSHLVDLRRHYQRLVPSWMDGIVFAHSPHSSAAAHGDGPEREVRLQPEQETSQELEVWLARSKAMAAVPIPAVKPIVVPSTARQTSRPHVSSAAESPSTVTAAPGKSEELTSEPLVADEDQARGGGGGGGAGLTHTSSPSTNRRDSSRRQSFGVVASPRYAPQALSPIVHSTAAAAVNTVASAGSSDKIQFQLLPLPGKGGGGGVSHDPAQRRLFADDDNDGDGDADEDDVEARRDALRMDSVYRGPSSPAAHHGVGASTSSPLPLIGSGTLVVPSSLTTRRILAYICQKLWREPATAELLPAEMRCELEKQRTAKEKHHHGTAGAPPLHGPQGSTSSSLHAPSAPSDVDSSASPASAAVAAGREIKAQLVSMTPSKPPTAHGLAMTPSAGGILSPTGVGIHLASPLGNALDSPSDRRRTLSFSVTGFSTLAHAPTAAAAPGGSLAGGLTMPEQFLQLLLWVGPGPAAVAGSLTPAQFYLLSPDLEIGSVREVLLPKLRRAAERRNSVSVGSPTSPQSDTRRSDLLSALDSPPGAVGSSASSSSRLMLLYYTRTPAGEAWMAKHRGTSGGESTPIPAAVEATHPPSRLVPASARSSSAQKALPTSAAATTTQPPPPPPVVPRIQPSVQTAANLKVATPRPVPPIAAAAAPMKLVSPKGSMAPTPRSTPVSTPMATVPSSSVGLPVSSPRRPPSAAARAAVAATLASSRPTVASARTPLARVPPTPGATSLPSRSDPNIMATSNVGVIISRHQANK